MIYCVFSLMGLYCSESVHNLAEVRGGRCGVVWFSLVYLIYFAGITELNLRQTN